MTTPLAVSPRSATYAATPSAQRRTFSYVNSSAIRARQPSVPNTIRVGDGAAPVRVTSVLRFGAAFEQPLDERPVGRGRAQDGDGLRRGHPTPLWWRDDPQAPGGAPDDQVVIIDLDRLPGLDDRPGAACTEPRQQRRPRAEVGPADIHRGHHDLATLGRALHNGVVDRDWALDGLVRVLQRRRTADHRAERLEQARIARQRVADRPPPPQEDARVPRHALVPRELLGAGRLRLLLEPDEWVRTEAGDIVTACHVRD